LRSLRGKPVGLHSYSMAAIFRADAATATPRIYLDSLPMR